ncbi:glycosyl transferase family 8 [Enterococcus florum]|uniref:Glycosyl transferase family 8 n=1 Tax=Enterococcus florum TaxID=2480627 RepID=A0A4P5PBR5_9ENTE|nr:glycosyltransferase family 8 protein [Enterococcus florum]GCF95645.1 glycosyl transferase family 8 [Enterococcus florum]
MFSKIKELPIVTAADENYAPFLSVMIRSLLEKTSKDTPIRFYVIDDALSDSSKEKLMQTAAHYSDSAVIQFVQVDKSVYEDFLVSDHITTTAYFRISMPKLLAKKNYEKILYIDADTLILDDITKLYHQSLQGKTIGAVIDPGQTKALKRLGVDSTDYYFNSGVMVIDVASWNQQHITERTIEYLKTNGDKIIYHDQDALNAVLYENWAPFHPRWNMQSSLISAKHPAPNEAYDQLYKEGRALPAVVHFTGHDKPWNTLVGHPYQDLYMDLLNESIFEKVVDVR